MLDMISTHLKSLIGDKRGVTAVEYTVIAALILLAIIGGFSTLGGSLTDKLTSLNSQV